MKKLIAKVKQWLRSRKNRKVAKQNFDESNKVLANLKNLE